MITFGAAIIYTGYFARVRYAGRKKEELKTSSRPFSASKNFIVTAAVMTASSLLMVGNSLRLKKIL